VSPERPAGWSDAVRRLEAGVTHFLEGLAALGFLVMLVVAIVLVVLRYVFNSSITGANELITVVFVYCTAIGAAIAVGKREHIAIPAVAERLPKAPRKVVDALGLLLVGGLNAVLTWQSVTWIKVTGDFLMPSTELPRVVAQLSIPLGCGLACLWCLLRLVLALAGDEELGEAWAMGEEGDSEPAAK
jgi:TRAP-type C4-dicarboxylate transport system permease small subunit